MNSPASVAGSSRRDTSRANAMTCTRGKAPTAAGLALLLLLAALACGSKTPSGSDYLGLWGEFRDNDLVSQLAVSTLGDSFVIKSDDKQYEGVWTLTPEGNLKGGPMGMLIIAFDRKTGRAVLSGTGELKYLTKAAPSSDRRYAQQKRAMADMRTIARAMDSWRTTPGGPGRWRPDGLPQSVSELAQTARMDLPVSDPWGSPYLFTASATGFTLTSLGVDGKRDPVTPHDGTHSFSADIMYSEADGHMGFDAYPEGPQW